MALRSTSSSTSSLTVPVPASAAIDDIAIIVATVDTAAAVFETADWPAGFAELAQADVTRDGQTCAVGWKRLTAADSGIYTFGSPGASIGIIHCLLFSGRHATDPPVVSSNAIDNTALTDPVSIVANGVTAVAGDDLVWISVPDVTASGAGNGHAVPSGYTEQLDTENAFHNMCSATKENVSAGATGTQTGTFSITSGTSGYAAWTVRIPSTGGGGGAVLRKNSLMRLGVGR